MIVRRTAIKAPAVRSRVMAAAHAMAVSGEPPVIPAPASGALHRRDMAVMATTAMTSSMALTVAIRRM